MISLLQGNRTYSLMVAFCQHANARSTGLYKRFHKRFTHKCISRRKDIPISIVIPWPCLRRIGHSFASTISSQIIQFSGGHGLPRRGFTTHGVRTLPGTATPGETPRKFSTTRPKWDFFLNFTLRLYQPPGYLFLWGFTPQRFLVQGLCPTSFLSPALAPGMDTPVIPPSLLQH